MKVKNNNKKQSESKGIVQNVLHWIKSKAPYKVHTAIPNEIEEENDNNSDMINKVVDEKPKVESDKFNESSSAGSSNGINNSNKQSNLMNGNGNMKSVQSQSDQLKKHSSNQHYQFSATSKKPKSQWIFFLSYATFLLPVILSIIREVYQLYKDIQQQKDGQELSHSFLKSIVRHKTVFMNIEDNGSRFFIASMKWIMTLLFLYASLRLMGRYPGIKVHSKPISKHKDDVLNFVYYGLIMSGISGIASRIDQGTVHSDTNLTFIPLAILYTFMYTGLFELVKDQDITLSNSLLSNKLGLIVVTVAVLVHLGLFICLFISAYWINLSFFQMYLGFFIFGLAFFLLLVANSQSKFMHGHSFIHLHHWFWPIPLIHLCIFNTDIAMIGQAVFIAIHVHGVACFGVESMFYDTERRARHPSEFEWALKPHLVDDD